MPWDVPAWESTSLIQLPDAVGALTNALGTGANALEAMELSERGKDALTAAQSAIQGEASDATLLMEVLEQLLLDLLRTDVYMLPLVPPSLRSLLELLTGQGTVRTVSEEGMITREDRVFPYDGELGELEATFTMSLQDLQDANRPQFGPNSSVAGVVLMAGAPSVSAIINATRFLQNVLALDAGAAFQSLSDRMDAFRTARSQGVGDASQYAGAPPDWSRVVAGEVIPALGQLVSKAESAIRGYNAAGKTSELDLELASVASEWGSRLRDALTAIEGIIAAFNANQTPGVSWYRLKIGPPDPAGGGIAAFQHRFLNASNRPADRYLVGTVMLIGGPSVDAAWTSLSTILGL